MTTPASRNTVERVIVQALQNAKLIQPGDTVGSEQFASCFNRLNDIAMLWQIKGLKLWLNQDVTIPLVAGQASYVLSPTGDVAMSKPMRLLNTYYSDANGIRRPLIPLSWQEWTTLSQVTQTGLPNSFFEDKQATYIKVWVWLVPDAIAATGTFHSVMQLQMPTLTSLTDQMIFPQEWFAALHWGLADEICTGQPPEIVARCAQRAESFRMALEDWDVEDADVRFRPSSQGQMPSNFV